jgi:hypothetical protein
MVGDVEITARLDRREPSNDRELWAATVRGDQELHIAVHVTDSAAASGTRGTEAYVIELVRRKWASYPDDDRFARLQSEAPLTLTSNDVID